MSRKENRAEAKMKARQLLKDVGIVQSAKFISSGLGEKVKSRHFSLTLMCLNSKGYDCEWDEDRIQDTNYKTNAPYKIKKGCHNEAIDFLIGEIKHDDDFITGTRLFFIRELKKNRMW